MNVSRTALMVMRVAAVFQLLVGFALWSGKWYPILDLHRTVGVIYVVCFLIVCGASIAARRRVPLAVLGILLGLAISGVGFSQTAIMPGDGHNIVKVAHLLLSLLAFPIAEILGKSSSTIKQGM